jgi:antitoxin component YwqK of YwqJK toxin-antitoxin module
LNKHINRQTLFKTLRYIAFISLFAGPSLCSAQRVRFQFYRTRACTTVEKLDTDYALYKIPGSLDSDYSPKKGSVYLPKPGRYGISFVNGPLVLLDTVFDIRDTGLFVFRYKEPDHGLYLTGAADTPPLYTRCDEELNGYQEYYYHNGILEMRGTFRRGNSKDSIVTFYSNGKTQKRIIAFPKTIVITEFDSTGNLSRIRRSQNKNWMTYLEYRQEDFYPNGTIKRKESSIKKIIRIETFYSNGQLKLKQTKRYRTECYTNGIKSITYRWKVRRDHIMHTKDFTIYRTSYDTTGAITRKTIYEARNYYRDQPDFFLSNSDRIVSDEKFEGGKPILLVEDIETEDYLKKYPEEANEEEEDKK